MKLTGLIAMTLECLGIALLLIAIGRGMGQNPSSTMAIMGGCLLACGGFLWNKGRKRR